MQSVLPRIYGLETELGFFIRNPQQNNDPAAIKLVNLSPSPQASDLRTLFLLNGARFYVDTGTHPEYASAECKSIQDLVAHDRASELILAESLTKLQELYGSAVLLKHNTDGKLSTWGCHENYLLRKTKVTEELVRALVPFLVTRIIFCGAGLLSLKEKTPFKISQRADFMVGTLGYSTTNARAMITSKDEPHATSSEYYRLQLICGDANRLDISNYLKIGTTGLVLRLFEENLVPDIRLADPIKDLRGISDTDPTSWPLLKTLEGKYLSPIEVQELYIKAAKELATRCELPKDELLALDLWVKVIEDLKTDWKSCSDRVEWIAKYLFLEQYKNTHNLGWTSNRLKAVELSWSSLDPKKDLVAKMRQRGYFINLVSEAEITFATEHAPLDTRANIRSRCLHVAALSNKKLTVDWTSVAHYMPYGGTKPLIPALTLLDPFVYESDKAEEFIKAL